MPREAHVFALRLALTWPRNDSDPFEVRDALVKKYAPEWLVVGREKHKDDGLHLHAAMVLKKKVRVYHKDLDEIAGKHGDYLYMKSELNWLKYVVKDSDYAPFGIDVEKWLAQKEKKKSSTPALVAAMVKEGCSLEEIDELYPAYVLGNKRKLDEYMLWHKRRMFSGKLLPWDHMEVSAGYETVAATDICMWLNTNIKKPRAFKQPQLWLYGKPSTGKTTLIENLRERLRIYDAPLEDYDNEYEDRMYDLIWFDEFDGQRPIYTMNRMLQGNTMPIRTKGGQTYKCENLPVIICSNLSPRDVYCKSASVKLDALESRLLVVFTDQPIRLDHVTNLVSDDNMSVGDPVQAPVDSEGDSSCGSQLYTSPFISELDSDNI